jgi:hypothetical protein
MSNSPYRGRDHQSLGMLRHRPASQDDTRKNASETNRKQSTTFLTSAKERHSSGSCVRFRGGQMIKRTYLTIPRKYEAEHTSGPPCSTSG